MFVFAITERGEGGVYSLFSVLIRHAFFHAHCGYDLCGVEVAAVPTKRQVT